MKRKGVAIPYIIALILGIIVVVFIAYWFYRMFINPSLGCEDLKARMVQWCGSCALSGATSGTSVPSGLDAISSCAYGITISTSSITKCNDIIDECKKVGVTITPTTAPAPAPATDCTTAGGICVTDSTACNTKCEDLVPPKTASCPSKTQCTGTTCCCVCL
jgi:hypothetical protein